MVTETLIHCTEQNAISIAAIGSDLDMIEGKKCNTTEALGKMKFKLIVYRKKGTRPNSAWGGQDGD